MCVCVCDGQEMLEQSILATDVIDPGGEKNRLVSVLDLNNSKENDSSVSHVLHPTAAATIMKQSSLPSRAIKTSLGGTNSLLLSRFYHSEQTAY